MIGLDDEWSCLRMSKEFSGNSQGAYINVWPHLGKVEGHLTPVVAYMRNFDILEGGTITKQVSEGGIMIVGHYGMYVMQKYLQENFRWKAHNWNKSIELNLHFCSHAWPSALWPRDNDWWCPPRPSCSLLRRSQASERGDRMKEGESIWLVTT